MKQAFKYTIRLSVLISLLLLFSCTQDDTVDNVTLPAEGITLSVTLPKAEVKATTEDGDDILNENLIKTLDVFIYKENTDDCLFYQRLTLNPGNTGTGIYSKDLNVTQARFDENVNHHIYVVANYAGTIAEEGLSLSDLKKLTVTSLNPDVKQDFFVMDGLHQMILNDGVVANKIVPVTLKRAAAKIRVSMNYANGFSLMDNGIVTKKLIQYATNGSLIADGNQVTPDLQTLGTFTNQNSGAGNSNYIIMYSYANDWNADHDDETYMIVNIPVKDTEGNTHPQNYYRIPLNYLLPSDNDSTNPSDHEALYKLERNYLYDVLMVVSQLGSTNPETATEIIVN